LVLDVQIIDDLLEQDETFNTRYQNHTEGAIAEKFCGFKIYESVYAPEFTVLVKK
jgi:hypothetical protein